MCRSTLLALGFLLFSVAVPGQTPSTDSQTLQALLAEVRQLRQDLRTANVAAQRAQILIYRVQAHEAVVRRLQERVDDTHSRLAQTQFEQKRLAAGIKQIEDRRRSTETPPAEQKQLDEDLAQVKARFEEQTNREQETQQRLIEAEEQLRIEQAKLGRLQDELDRLDKALEDSTRQGTKQP